MLYWYVRRFYRLGVMIPRHFFAQQVEALGAFRIVEERDPETRRVARVASLQPHPHFPGDMPPALFDATVVHAGGSAWTVNGFERDYADSATMLTCYQSWFMRPLSPKESIELEEQALQKLRNHIP